MAYGSIAELMAADRSFAIPGVVPSRKEPILPKEPPEIRREIFDVPTEPIRTRPGGVRLPLAQSDMQEKLQPALPPVRKAAEDLLEETIAQVTPKNMGYGFEADLSGTFGGRDGVYIRNTFPEESDYRDRQYEYMKERMGNPFRGV